MSSPKKTTHGVRFMEKTLNPLLHEMKLREQRFSTLDFVIGAGFALIAAAAAVIDRADLGASASVLTLFLAAVTTTPCAYRTAV